MKQIEAVEKMMRGEIMVTAEWRSSVAKSRQQENERTEKLETKKVIVHQVEMMDFKTKTDMPFEVTEEKEETFDADKYNTNARPFAKGDRVFIEVKSFGWSQNKSRYMGKGILYPIDKTAAGK